MSWGTAIVYTRDLAFIDALVERGPHDGVTLANPANGAITMLSPEAGFEGDQVPLERDALVKVISELTNEVTFQFWLRPDSDVVCDVRTLDQGIVRWGFSFDGLVPEEIELVVRWLMGAIAAPGSSVVGVAIDRDARAAGYDWDGAVLKRWHREGSGPGDLFLTA